ncbi:sel1 repeat family protein, partial [bacterium]|nr:sel1 repeat family protein [bacterium]
MNDPAFTPDANQEPKTSAYKIKSINSRKSTLQEQEIFAVWKKKADKGHIDAQFEVASLYESGVGCEQSYPLAFHYFKLAADKGDEKSQVNLGRLYEHGLGTEQSSSQAVHYYKMAAKQGFFLAYDYLAEAYDKGLGVTCSAKTAEFYRHKKFLEYKKLADGGDPNAQVVVGLAFEKGEGIEKSSESAFHYFKLAADQNYQHAFLLLAKCYAQG